MKKEIIEKDYKKYETIVTPGKKIKLTKEQSKETEKIKPDFLNVENIKHKTYGKEVNNIIHNPKFVKRTAIKT